MNYDILQGDCIETMRGLPSGIVQTCVTSPPYYGLRAYLDNDDPNKAQEIGLEESPDVYVSRLVDVFREVRRVLRDDGTLWLNLGDSYSGSGGPGSQYDSKATNGYKGEFRKYDNPNRNVNGLGPKQLLGIPWRVAFALQADGWILRSEIIWHKKACMPESVQDRPTKSHEQVFLLAKSPHYYYDADAIREPHQGDSGWAKQRMNGVNTWDYGREGYNAQRIGGMSGKETGEHPNGRNKRSVWTLGPEPSGIQHFAVMPTKLVEPCILAGTSARGCCAKCGAPWARVVERTEPSSWEIRKTLADKEQPGVLRNDKKRDLPTALRDESKSGFGLKHTATTGWEPTCTCNADVVPCLVLDPFSGSGTVGAVALKHGRKYIGCELNEDYITLSHRRIQQSQPMLLLEGV